MTHCGPKYSLCKPQWPNTIYYDLKLLHCFALTQNELAWHSKSCHRNNFRGKFGPETSKYVLLNKTQSMELFKGFDSEFDYCFLKFHHQSTFSVKKMTVKSKILCCKWNSSDEVFQGCWFCICHFSLKRHPKNVPLG